MKLKRIEILIVIVFQSLIVYPQEVGKPSLNALNNAYWEIKKINAKREIRESFYKSSDVTPIMNYQKTYLKFSKDSLIFMKLCEANKIVVSNFHYKITNTDSVKFYSSDFYKAWKDKEIYKYPYLRKFKHSLFCYVFKARKLENDEIVLVCKKPRIKLWLKYIKKDTDNGEVLDCEGW